MINLVPNEKVCYKGRLCFISKTKDLESVFIIDEETRFLECVRISDLEERPKGEAKKEKDDRPSESYSKEQLARANKRLKIIRPFLGKLRGDKAEMRKTAEANDVGLSTMYKWIARFDQHGHVNCLIDAEEKGGKGGHRLDEELEKEIREVIQSVYMEDKSFARTYKALSDRVEVLGLKLPHENTLRRRIQETSAYQRMAKRQGPKTAAQTFDPKIGSTPNADFPLELVQMDHTKLDIMLVDEKERKPFKRPWITVVIDSFSRMVLGFYISFDPPSSFAVGRAIVNAMLQKEKFLKSLGLEDLKWNCWGKMSTIYVDNAKEFRGEMLRENCANYNITLKWRPVKTPAYGGIIERYMGTIASELKDLPGATKVSKEMRAKFRPETTASFTLPEFERWFTVWLTEVYHKRSHQGIGDITPEEKWRQGVFGFGSQPGIGLPQLVTDEDKLRMDFLPQFKRTIQRTGVHLHQLTYFSGILRQFINQREETARGKIKPPKKFVFKMDPRNISSIYFLNPTDKKYHRVQSNVNIHPDVLSIWDHRKLIAELKKAKKKVTQDSIISAFRRLIDIEDESKRKTKDAKRRDARNESLRKDEPTQPATMVVTRNESVPAMSKNQIKPYEEVEHTRRSFK